MANVDALLEVAQAEADRTWGEIVPVLQDYIRIPALSPAFDPDWADHGHLEAAVTLVRDWLTARPIDGLTVDVRRLARRTPVVIAEIPATRPDLADDTVLLYGHLDKQPEFDGWRAGFGPWEPVLEGERLYGRGGADDGYAAFASLAAIEAVRAAGADHARCVLVIEASEESGSVDLPAHVDALAGWLGTPSLVLCLDSGCGDFERLWVTTSLRGLAGGRLEVEILTEGVHSGEASGVVPSSFRILRTLLDRVEDASTGAVRLDALHAAIPEARVAQARAAVQALGHGPAEDFPFVAGARPPAGGPAPPAPEPT